jgi:hypothetical protein
VKRDGDRDLAFTGWILGSGKITMRQKGAPKECERGTEAWIFLTLGRRLVTAVTQWDRTSEPPNETNRAAAHQTAAAALAWLRQDTRNNMLGPASGAAWSEACQAWPGLEDEDVERVE